jgi:hypothetical protein
MILIPDVLEQLKTYSGDTATELARVATIKTYLDSIPGTILGIQLDATTKLNSLIPLTNPGDIPTRYGIIQQLLAYDNVWGTEQIGILNILIYPEAYRPPEIPENVPSDDLLIFGLRLYLTTVSYYLTGLSQLKPGTTEQVATVNKVTEILDNTKAEYDIIKFGLKAVLDDIPGKTAYTRSRIVYAAIKSGTFTLGERRGIWSDTQIDQLNSLKVDPGSNVTLIAEQRATIDSLIGFLVSLDDINGYISQQLTALDGELNYDTRDDIINNLLNLVNFYKSLTNRLDLVNPADFWSQTEIDLLEELRDSDLAYAGTVTEDTYISDLTSYASSQTVSDSLYAKGVIDSLLDGIVAAAGDQATRATLVATLLAFDVIDVEGVEDRPYWDDATRVLINALDDDATLPTEYLTTHIPAIRVYMNAVVYGLRLIIEGLVGSTGIEYTIDRLLTLLDGETDQTTREDLVDGLLAIPSVWRQTEVNLLNVLKTPSLPDESDYILALRLQSGTISFNVAAGIIPGGFPGASLEERIANVTILQLLPVWENTTIKLVNELWTSTLLGYLNELKDDADPLGGTPLEDTYIAALRAYTSNTQIDGLLTLLDGQTDQTTRETIVDQIIAIPKQVLPSLINYLTGKLGSIPILKFRLDVLKAGVNGVLDNLPATAAERDPIIVGISTLYTWSDTQFYFLNALRTPSAYDLIYINALKISTGSLDSLTTDPVLRPTVVGGLLAIPNFWTTEQTALITALFNPLNDATTIPALNALVTNVPVMTGYTQFDQNNVIDGLISETIWGEKYFDLNDLRQIEPGFVGQTKSSHNWGTILVKTYHHL